MTVNPGFHPPLTSKEIDAPGYGSWGKRVAFSEDTLMDAKWMSEKGLNNIQLLNHLLAAQHATTEQQAPYLK